MAEFGKRRGRHLDADWSHLQHLRQGRHEEHRIHLQKLAQDLAGHEPDPGCAHSLYYASGLQCHGYILIIF